VGKVSTSGIEEGTAVLAVNVTVANGNVGTDHSSHSSHAFNRYDEIPGCCNGGTAFPQYLCFTFVNSHEAAEELISFATFMPVLYSVILMFVFLGTTLCCMLYTSIPVFIFF
jgi:hypothetical protein